MQSATLKLLLRQFFFYVFVGGIAFIADYGLLLTLHGYLGLHYLLAAFFAFLLGLVVNYSLCLVLVFNERVLDSRHQEFILFALVGIAGLVLTELIMWLATDGLGWAPRYSKLLAAAIVLFFNFVMRRQMLFAKNSRWAIWIAGKLITDKKPSSSL